MNTIIQSIIALIGIIAIFSIANSLLLETIRIFTKDRIRTFDKAITDLLAKGGDKLVESFNKSGIKKIFDEAEGKRNISSLPSNVFAENLIATISKLEGDKSKSKNKKPDDLFEDLRQAF